MQKNMSYLKLSREYREQIAVLNRKIEDKKSDMKLCITAKERHEIERTIDILISMRSDVLYAYSLLRNYIETVKGVERND